MARQLLVEIIDGPWIDGTIPTVPYNTAYSTTLTARNARTPVSWSIIGTALPTGLAIDPDTGEISGTTTVAGEHTVTVGLRDGNGDFTSRTFTFRVVALPLSISGSFGDASVGSPMAGSLTVSGGVPPYTLLAGWTAPSGSTLSLSTATIADTGATDTVDTGQTYSGTVKDSEGAEAPFSGSVDVAEASSPVEGLFKTGTYTGDNGTSPSIATDFDCSGGFVMLLRRHDGAGGSLRMVASDGTTTWHWDPSSSFVASSGLFTGGASGVSWTDASFNTSGSDYTYSIWKRAPGVVDISSYTGNFSNRSIAHNHGMAVGMFYCVRTSGSGSSMPVWMNGMTGGNFLVMSSSGAQISNNFIWNLTTPDSSNIYLGQHNFCNQTGVNFIVISWAHDTSSEGVQRVDGYSGGTGGTTVTSAGWQPQFVLAKSRSGTGYFVAASEADNSGWSGDDPFGRIASGAWTTDQDNVGLVTGGFELPETNTDWNESGKTYAVLQVRRP